MRRSRTPSCCFWQCSALGRAVAWPAPWQQLPGVCRHPQLQTTLPCRWRLPAAFASRSSQGSTAPGARGRRGGVSVAEAGAQSNKGISKRGAAAAGRRAGGARVPARPHAAAAPAGMAPDQTPLAAFLPGARTHAGKRKAWAGEQMAAGAAQARAHTLARQRGVKAARRHGVPLLLRLGRKGKRPRLRLSGVCAAGAAAPVLV